MAMEGRIFTAAFADAGVKVSFEQPTVKTIFAVGKGA